MTASWQAPLVDIPLPGSVQNRGGLFVPALILVVAIISLAFYGKLRPNLNSEYVNIAQAMITGRGFADPFHVPTGPTAWMPPVFPGLLAGLLWLGGGSPRVVSAALVGLHVAIFCATGLLVMVLSRNSGRRLGAAVAAGVFLVTLLCHFHYCFELANDPWLVLLAVDVLLIGMCWFRPAQDRLSAYLLLAWGVCGGLVALINPIVGFVWILWTLGAGLRSRAWRRTLVAVLVAGLTLVPWTVRNYLVFGQLIPVKANAAYELFQSQCLQRDGLLQRSTFSAHPIRVNNPEGLQYRELGEIDYLRLKWRQFLEAVQADPGDFLARLGTRLLGATLWYEPFDRLNAARRPLLLWGIRLLYPLPFLAILVLLFSSRRQWLDSLQYSVIAIYGLYLLPYAVISYYERYAIPLVAVKALLVFWAADRIRWTSRSACVASGRLLD